MKTRIIAFTGPMFAGKSLAITGLDRATSRKCINVKFAGTLYSMQEKLYEMIKRPVPKPKDRKLLQWLGTEWGREIDPNLWVNLWKREVEETLRVVPECIVTADDCRFDNEAEIVKSLGGVIIRVNAPLAHREARAAALGMQLVAHASEAGISDRYVDITLDNGSDEESMYLKMEKVAMELGL